VCNNSKQFSITIGVKEEKKRENWTRKNIWRDNSQEFADVDKINLSQLTTKISICELK
jgi:hypothetical protein